MNFIIAGRDTTASLLTWLFFALVTDPEMQDKLIQEIDQQLAGEDPTFETVSAANMPYLNGAVYEALRLYPPVPTVLTSSRFSDRH